MDAIAGERHILDKQSMKIQRLGFSLVLVTFMILATSCNQSLKSAGTPFTPSVPIGLSISTLTPIPVYTHTFTTTITPNPTTISYPLKEDSARTRLLELLANNRNCRLPCLWGITPGNSTYQEAQAILAPLSNISDPLMTGFWPAGGSINPIFIEGNLATKVFVNFYVNIKSTNHIVNHITFQIREEEITKTIKNEPSIRKVFDSKSFSERTRTYGLGQVLSEQGIPEAVLIQTYNAQASLGHNLGGGFDILLLYPGQGLLAHYITQLQVVGQNIRGCPANAHVELELFPSGDENSFSQFLSQTQWAGMWPLPSNKPFWTPIEKVTNMTVEQFYQTFRQSPDQCIETPAKLWPAPFR